MTYFGLLHVILVNHDHLNILDYVCYIFRKGGQENVQISQFSKERKSCLCLYMAFKPH